MPDIVQGTDAPVNGPPVPAELQPIQGPPVPAGTPVPVAPGNAPPTLATGVAEVPRPAPSVDPLVVGREAIGDAQAARADEAKAAAAEAKAQQEKADAEAKQAEAQAAEIRKRQEDNDRQQQAAETARARLTALAEKADSDVGNFKFTDYRDTIPASKKIRLIIGGALMGAGGGDPLAVINKNIAQHFDQQKAELSSKESVAKYRRQGVEDHDRHINDQRMYLEFQERNYREAMAKETEAQGLRSGSPVALAKSQQLAAKMRADGDAKLMGMVDQYARSEEQRAHADLLKRKARGAGGGASNAALSQLVDAASSGASQADLVKLALKLKVKDPLGTVKKLHGDLKADAGGGVDTKLLVHNADGTPAGLASTSRAVPQIQKELRTLPRAIEQLKQLRANNSWNTTTRSPYFHNAVLAVAATTSAGSTDANVTHEKGTLTNALGLPDNDSIDRKIAELENQLAATQNQLEPLPESYVPARRAGKVGDVVGGDKLDAPAAPKAPAAVIDAARAAAKGTGPKADSARKFLDQQGVTVL